MWCFVYITVKFHRSGIVQYVHFCVWFLSLRIMFWCSSMQLIVSIIYSLLLPSRFPLSFPYDSVSKISTCNVGDMGLISGLGWSPRREHGNPPQYSCLEHPHGQRSLAGCSPWGHKESDTTEWLSSSTSFSSYGYTTICVHRIDSSFSWIKIKLLGTFCTNLWGVPLLFFINF